MRPLLLAAAVLVSALPLHAQILCSEAFSLVTDTARRVAGARTRLKYGAYLAAKAHPSEQWSFDASLPPERL